MQAIKFHEYRPGNEDFSHYIDRLNYCFVANGICDDNVKLANFYTICGSEVFETVLALIIPRKSHEVSFNYVVDLLTKHYTPKSNEITMSYKFYNRNQREGEKALDYLTELRKIAAHCNFSNLERNLRDRLVCGMQDEKLKFELLKRDNLTYKEVVDCLTAAETAHRDVTIVK
ncbi:uncharacterized protein LOC131840864 [Achroia grisella]|uniref:uncharacterized protein LOC131840864 n=1 Tax=Achroia grisella TaxID=688607 RepID=UPI0027D33FE8|nr:uncharacterized protein LOC131840864 [Achroia grisella]